MIHMVATDKYIITAKELHVDLYNYSEHRNIKIPVTSKPNEKDDISDIAVSSNHNYLAVITLISKQLLLYNLQQSEFLKSFVLPRSASKLRFTVDNTQILVADKSGDVLIYDIEAEGPGIKLLGHLSLLLDVLQTNDSRYIISSDRDEKIRVSCYPNTYNIQTYCLGHKEFVNHIELLPHNDQYLTSSSGDGTIKIWNYINGKLYHTINTASHVKDDQIKQNFINLMDEGGIEVQTLPIVHYTISTVNQNCSIIALTVLSCNYILIYIVSNAEDKFQHELKHQLEVDTFPSAIRLFKDNLFIYNDKTSNVVIYKLVQTNESISVEATSKIQMFENNSNTESKEIEFEAIKVLYKRKFDNVQEYQERKKQRLEKSTK